MAKIILIDDDYATEILVENLEFRGYEARRISSAAVAFQSIDDTVDADLVILDIIMERPTTTGDPKISGDRTTGMELLLAIRKRNPTLPVLVFSATNDKNLIDAVNRTPNAVFLPKWNAPSLQDIFDKIERAIKRPAEVSRRHSFIVHGHDTAE